MDRARQTDLLTRPTATSRRGKRAAASARPVPNLRGQHTCSIAVAGDEPPTEFRIFTAGEVVTTKGTFTFDEAAAKSVMAGYVAHGIDVMIDYDHAALSAMPVDPALSGRAAGWFNLEVRNGELWAVNVRWTAPAAEALRAKEWRFMSPAFSTDDKGHVTSLMNVAITNLPATRRLEPLMAASVTALSGEGMDPKLISEALDALIAGDEGKCADLLKSLVAAAAGGEKPGNAAEDAVDGGADDAQETPVAAAIPAADPTKEDKPAEMAAALSAVASLSGKPSLVASIADIRTWHTSHVELATEKKKIAEREAVLESAERRKIGTELVTLAGDSAGAVWEQFDAAGKAQSGVLKPYLLSMPIADLRAMHADRVKTNAGKGGALKAPVDGAAGAATDGSQDVKCADGRVVRLSAREVSMCAELKVELKDYAARKPAEKG